MGYSKIKSIEVENFMAYSHAIINFDDSNIINLKGYNSSGKSSMLKAIAVCLMNMYPKAQSKFIRHGEQYFRIAISFDDGIVIRKDKYINGKSLYEVYKDSECIFSTKEGNSLTKVADIPQSIQDYLGLCSVSLGCLNYQVRQDPLWLIETTGSKNYASLNEILKSDELARANAMLNSDLNKLCSEITSIEASLQETRLSLAEANGYSDILLANLEKRELICKQLTAQYRSLKSILDLSEEISGIKSYPEVTKVDDVQLSEVSDILDTANSIDEVEFPEIEKVSSDKLKDIQGIQSVLSEIEGIEEGIPELSEIGQDKLVAILDIASLISEIYKIDTQIKSVNNEYDNVSTSLESVVKEAEKKGIKYIKCDNCGSYVEAHVGVHNHA